MDLPLGGPKGVRTALQTLIDIALIATRDQQGTPRNVFDTDDDDDGTATIYVLTKTYGLAGRITGNENGSLGLHPAVYFYGPTGRHSGPMFMGTMTLVGRKLSNNDKTFFNKFTQARSKLEHILVHHKDLIATIIQKHIGPKRVDKYADLLNDLIDHLNAGEDLNELEIIRISGLDGKIFVGSGSDATKSFSDDAKSEAFIMTALRTSIKCPICDGYLDTDKSVSYDHIVRARDGGSGRSDNCNLTHPYCNQSIKN